MTEREALKAALTQLHLDAGAPSGQFVSRRLGGALSHTSFYNMLNGAGLPQWHNLKAVVEVLCAKAGRTDNDALVARFHALWSAAKTATPQLAAANGGAEADTAGEPEYFRLTPADLKAACVLPYALDDQWATRQHLKLAQQERISLDDLGAGRRDLIRQEFVRSLISAEQVVVNRSFLFRNPAVVESYVEPESRSAFVQLLGEEAIVVFLIKESSPLKSHFAQGLAAEHWRQVEHEGTFGYLRFSWVDKDNDDLCKAWDADFATRIRRSASLRLDRLLEDVGAEGGNIEDMRNELLRLAKRATGKGEVTINRASLYRRYLVRAEADVKPGRYDFDKPNVVALKWLFDLTYNSNLATRLGIAISTPVDSAHRSLVHSPNFFQPSDDTGTFDPARVRAAIMEAVQNAVFRAGDLSIFAGVTLPQVVEIRRTEAWTTYRDAVHILLTEPWLIGDPKRGLRHVLTCYERVVHRIVR
ncbi:hypothetical protein [Micromonospora coerulea]|uniref:hypothetical protein n=1 Tax=Micromonospora coerulea TaxID=47856 RepID=UPI001907F5EB|nr:hypothetical protein [Micromonospora veneta]